MTEFEKELIKLLGELVKAMKKFSDQRKREQAFLERLEEDIETHSDILDKIAKILARTL
jgi:hypothetical protein